MREFKILKDDPVQVITKVAGTAIWTEEQE